MLNVVSICKGHCFLFFLDFLLTLVGTIPPKVLPCVHLRHRDLGEERNLEMRWDTFESLPWVNRFANPALFSFSTSDGDVVPFCPTRTALPSRSPHPSK